ncbi:MAG: two pore domain potassium channel family protein [Rhodobacterales bacterium]|nr:two pore domain potassium channel family protein [Rhodobacterales bacterium]
MTTRFDTERRRVGAFFGALTGIFLLLLGGSTVFFHYQEGWSWIDAWFFTVTTVSTVGYGNLVPATTIGKLVTTGLIFSGIGLFGLAATQIANNFVNGRHRPPHDPGDPQEPGSKSD